MHSLFAAAHTVARGFYPGKSVTYDGILEVVLCHFLSAQGTEPGAFVSKWENRMRHSDAIAIFNGSRPAGDTSRADFWKKHAPKPKYRTSNRPEERRVMYNREFLPGIARASTPPKALTKSTDKNQPNSMEGVSAVCARTLAFVEGDLLL